MRFDLIELGFGVRTAGLCCKLIAWIVGTGDLRDAMTDEIDFVKEATNVETFRNYLSNSGLESIATAPYVYRQLSTQRCVLASLCRASGAT